MEMQKQTRAMIRYTLKNTAMNVSKLQVSLTNAQSQLNIDKISSLEKDNNIKFLEESVIKIGYDPANVKEEKY